MRIGLIGRTHHATLLTEGLQPALAEPVIESTSRHSHEALQVAWVVRGQGRVFCRGRGHDVPEASTVVFPAGEAHHGHSSGPGGWAYLMLDVEAHELTDAAQELSVSAERVFDWVVSEDPALSRAFCRLHESVIAHASRLERQTAMAMALEALVLRSTRPGELTRVGKERRAIGQVCAFLREHLDDDVSLDALAHLTGLSRFHLVRVFSREVGLPPHAWQNQLRVRRALALLRTGKTPDTAALEVGFVSQSHMHRHFKRVLGVTPGQARARLRVSRDGSKNVEEPDVK